MIPLGSVEVVGRRTAVKYAIVGLGSLLLGACSDDTEESDSTAGESASRAQDNDASTSPAANDLTTEPTDVGAAPTTSRIDNDIVAFVQGSWTLRQVFTVGPGGEAVDESDARGGAFSLDVGDSTWEVFEPDTPDRRESGTWELNGPTVRVVGDFGQGPGLVKRVPDVVDTNRTYRLSSGYASAGDEGRARVTATSARGSDRLLCTRRPRRRVHGHCPTSTLTPALVTSATSSSILT